MQTVLGLIFSRETFSSHLETNAIIKVCLCSVPAYLQHPLGKWQVTPWTGHQPITERWRFKKYIFTYVNFRETPVNQTGCVFLDCGRKPGEKTWREAMILLLQTAIVQSQK